MAHAISVVVDPESIPTDAKTTSTITATLTDGAGPVTTATKLTFAVTPAVGCALSAATADTDATTGIASVTATASLPGSYTITVSEESDETVKNTGTLTAVMAYTISVAPDTTLIAPLGGEILLDATVLDFLTGEPVKEVDVTWSVDSGGLYVALSSGTSKTDGTGVAKVTATNTGQGVLGSITAKIGALTTASCNVFFSAPTVPAVSILNADEDHVLDAAEIAFGVEAYIYDPDKGPYVGGDNISLYWGKGPEVVDSKHFPLDSTTQFPIPVDISELFNSDCLLNGDYDVFYVFTDSIQNTHCSRNFPLTIDGVTPPSDLPAPTFPEASNNTINADVASEGTTMRIRYADMTAGDHVTIFWQEYRTNGDPVTTSTYTTDFDLDSSDATLGFYNQLIPQENIAALIGNGTAQSYYEVVHKDGSTQTSAIATLSVVLY